MPQIENPYRDFVLVRLPEVSPPWYGYLKGTKPEQYVCPDGTLSGTAMGSWYETEEDGKVAIDLYYEKQEEEVTKPKLKLEVGKTYLNRRGESVRIICTDADRKYPVVGLRRVDTKEIVMAYTAEGRFCMGEGGQNDLVKEKKEPRVIYVNEYSDGAWGACYHETVGSAKATAGGVTTFIRTVKFVEEVE